ncbi:ABC transporter permease [Pseudooctadecabacter jejudonensis]|uniref:Glutathione transport system permease protein GsiC n=1 Tax=Pseudooctadecabacter jejudonensis TaxID=1391910 RepID=A0A1Y5RP32_9RHOB|nr:ABC transporter permease [Pseudooctadecabacter jejudonensis]SLN19367.1 Glutathione transport system permease protein GsiC [Pseudooctadecabacter jejudonensis]
MLTYTIRRLLTAIPTLIFISLIIFLLLDMAPGDPTAQLPLTIPPEVREQIRQSLGLGEPVHIRYLLWLKQMMWSEPMFYLSQATGWFDPPETARLISWQTRAPVMDTIFERLPQTIMVVGLSYVVGVLIALPIGIISAYKQYSVFDQTGTFVSMIGFSIPPFFSGVLMIIIFSVSMDRDSFWWFPSIYDTTLVVDSWETFKTQVRQMVLPVMVLALQTTAQISRFMRASMLDNLNQDYVRTARAKGMTESVVVLKHVLRNSMIPVVTVIALGIPAIFGGAIITEQIFKVNGIGQFLIVSIQASDVPSVQTLTFIFAVLIVFFNLIADILYGILDPRIRYD